MALDNLPIALLSYTAHQSSVSALGLDDPVLQDISATKRSATGVDLAATFIDIVANHPTYEWNALLGEKIAAVGPEYRQVFGAITTSCLNLLFPAEIVDPIVRLVANSIMSKEEAAFLADVYSPRFRNKTVDVRARLSFGDRFSLGLKGVGTLGKLMYAFLWQEEIIPGPWLRDKDLNRLGGEAMPIFNMLCNAMNGFPHADKDVQAGRNVYPGDKACRVGMSPHTKWHEEAGNGLLDLMFLAEEVDRVIRTHQGSLRHKRKPTPSPGQSSSSWISFWASHWWGSERESLMEL